MELIDTFLDLASPEIFGTLSALDLHNLRNTHRRLDAAVTERLARPPQHVSMSSMHQKTCRLRLDRAWQFLETDDASRFTVNEAVAHHTAMFRNLLHIIGRRRHIPPAAFALAVPTRHHVVTGWGTKVSETAVETTVTVGEVYVHITSTFSNAHHHAFISYRPMLEPEYSVPREFTNALELGVAIAEKFKVKTMGAAKRWRKDPLYQFLNM